MRNAASRSWAWRGVSLRSSSAARSRDGDRVAAIAAAQEIGLEGIEMGELLRARHPRVIGDVVGGAHELVERENRRAMLRRDQQRGDREVLVPMALARTEFGGLGHFAPAAWNRPFHNPPLPRIEAIADCTVNTR